MKNYILFFMSIIIGSCSINKSNTPAKANKEVTNRITDQITENEWTTSVNGTWILETIDGDSIKFFSTTLELIKINGDKPPTPVKTYPYADGGMQNPPKITIDTTKMIIYGNDGCNNIRGGIKAISDVKLIFSPLMTTLMGCGEMQIPHKFNNAIQHQVENYIIIDRQLVLFDKSGKKLMVLNKVVK